MRQRLMVLLAAASVTMTVAGCSPTPVGGTGTPTNTNTSSTSSLPAGTPNVAHPLDSARFQKAPCSVLTSAQLGQLNITTTGGKVIDDPLGPHCGWADTGPSHLGLSIIFLTSGSGLASIYSQKDTYKAFVPLSDIAGYPAVIAMTDDTRSQGTCEVSVGLTNQLAIDVMGAMNSGGPDGSNPCPRVQAIATAMVTTIKGGS
ncbi:DUF3558 domain-containing protein [Kutzneria sp. NPDC052558]|uniref:DUF3558 domain-containing protein n=1 Tax=Kutzneria sp. NPDC052558 TaxID=3364121 RepID=UPI0037C52CF2